MSLPPPLHYFFLVAVSLAGAACHRAAPPADPAAVTRLAVERYGEADCTPNPAGDLILCTNRVLAPPGRPGSQAATERRFFIYDLAADSMLYETTVAASRVVWHNDSLLLVQMQPAIRPGDDYATDPTIYLLDVRTGERKVYRPGG